jgi:hypothetical protein
MKISTLLICISLFVLSCSTQTVKESPKLLAKLDSLIEHKSFFELKRLFNDNEKNLSVEKQLYYSGLIEHFFNNAAVSNQKLTELLKTDGVSYNDSMLYQVYKAKRMNHINLYEYAQAVETSQFILDHFKAIADSADFAEYENEHKIWQALKNTPKQEVIKKSDCVIPMRRDKVGLMNVITIFDTDTVNFLFDTGANFSAIKRSKAQELGMEIIEAEFYVTAATGKKVNGALAIAKEFQIADITVKNAVFLVFEDEDISFPQIDYYPNGAIGFPVIEAFDELQFKKEGEIFIPQNAHVYSYNNLALDGLMPVLAVIYNTDTLRFNFDTGGSKSTLYKPFYEKYKAFVEKNYQVQQFSSASGGGSVEFEGYVIDSLALSVADSKATLSKLQLHINALDDAKSFIHGNFGQDYIKQFAKMIVSFKHSAVVFE